MWTYFQNHIYRYRAYRIHRIVLKLVNFLYKFCYSNTGVKKTNDVIFFMIHKCSRNKRPPCSGGPNFFYHFAFCMLTDLVLKKKNTRIAHGFTNQILIHKQRETHVLNGHIIKPNTKYIVQVGTGFTTTMQMYIKMSRSSL